ncbi:type IV secretory system conjugative DNA transfer family protein [Desulfospira joergensenii]|uniref:type IV secretory system conjugative DNA transfer family protein n=1 Tax=Desulfospira joergensenii TaxID=53329 RepID=UPI0003B6676D|nr:type IV secretory system conjugative DNA transfer family protein [Desulfospira joergensenii]
MKKAFCNLTDLSTILVFYLIFWAGVVWFGEIPISLENIYWNAPFLALKKLSFPFPDWYNYTFLAALGLAAFVPIFNPFRSKSGIYGKAHFATDKEIKKMELLDDTGLILAVKGGKYIRTNAPLSVNVYAPPGTGKTAAIVIPCLISCSNSMIVHDPKGELYAKTRKRREEFSKVIKFSPGEKGSDQWNPLSKKELPDVWADIEVIVDRVANTVIPDNPKNPGEHWPKAGRSFFMFWALYLIYRDGETTLPKVLREPFQTEDIKAAIAEIQDEYKNSQNFPERVRFEGNGLMNTPEGEFGSIVSTFKTNLSVFFDTRVAENFSGSDFALKDLRTERTTIYLTVKNNDQTRLKSLLALFFETCNNTMLDHEPVKGELPVTAIIDEAARIARMQEIINMPAIGRSYKFNAVFIWQSPGQVEKIYGKEDAKELLNTCAYHVYFTQNDHGFAEEISKEIGDLTRDKISESHSGRGFFRPKNISKEGYKLMTAQDIMSMSFGTILILTQGHFKTPIKTKAAFWFKDSVLKKYVEDVNYQDLSIEHSQAPALEEEKPEPVTIKNDGEGQGSLEIPESDPDTEAGQGGDDPPGDPADEIDIEEIEIEGLPEGIPLDEILDGIHPEDDSADSTDEDEQEAGAWL